MGRFIRYIVHQRIGRDSRRLGLFAASYNLLHEGDLFRYERARLVEWINWFERELTVPPSGAIPADALFWYVDLGRYKDGMWELVQIVKEHGFSVELITARFVGRVVYRDRYQCAAIPPRRRHR